MVILKSTLKVGGNEKNGGSGRSKMLDNGLEVYFQFEHAVFD